MRPSKSAPSTTKVRIVGLSGKIGAGKTHVANRLVTANFPNWTSMSFASTLKRDIEEMGFPREDVWKHKPPHIRRLLQAYGEARRAYDQDYWVRQLLNSINAVHAFVPNKVVVIDDVRYPNEVRAIHEAGGIVIRLVCSTDPVQSDAHESETALDRFTDFDATITLPRGELDALEQCVARVLWELM